MKHTIYANYGTLGYEKGTAYSAYVPMSTADLSEPLVVDIPNEFHPYHTFGDAIALTPPSDDEIIYDLQEILTDDANGDPILRWWCCNGRVAKTRKLTVLEKPAD